MKKVLLITGVVMLVAAAIVGGASGGRRLFPVRPGEGVIVKGTSINCGAFKKSGKNLITCFRLGKNRKPVVGSVAVTLSQKEAWVVRITKKGQGKILYHKKGLR